jgi:dipeptidyl aminopeptidase/acylaminoacyl peptidase
MSFELSAYLRRRSVHAYPRWRRRHVAALCLLAGFVTQTMGAVTETIASIQTDNLSSAEVARLMAEAPRVSNVALSPTASHVIYAVSRGNVDTNERTIDLFLQALNGKGGVAGAPIHLARRAGDRPFGFFGAQWCPDGQSFTYFGPTPGDTGENSERRGARAQGGAAHVAHRRAEALLRYDLKTGRVSTVPLRDNAEDSARKDRPRVTQFGGVYQWSPTGRFIAFTSPLTALPPLLDPRRGVDRSETNVLRSPISVVLVVDVVTGAVEQATPDDLNVLAFDWSPDERTFAISGTPPGVPPSALYSDLYLVDRRTRTARLLVSQPGMDFSAAWSPDGQWLSFVSHFGFLTCYVGWPALIFAGGGEIIRLAGDEDPKGGLSGDGIAWLPDSGSFYYATAHHMIRRLAKVDLRTRRPHLISDDERVSDGAFSFSRDRRWVAFTRESLAAPPELFIQSLPDGTPQRLTHLAVDFSLTSQVRIDRLSWPSRDKKFTIHGVLLTPASAWAADGATARLTHALPTLTFLSGGPSMASAGFAEDGFGGGLLPMAARGYAVLVPNTRGRGGYGEAFERGMRDGRSTAQLPYEDLIAGVDILIARGIADPDRLGVYGHSYGGYLTAYAITQTDRFRAAVVHEATPHERLTQYIDVVPGSQKELRSRDLHGIHNPFDPAERARLIAESPSLHVDRVSTPTLLVYGVNGGNMEAGSVFTAAFQRFKIPFEFVVFDEGHVFGRPSAIADDLRRTADWLDYWIRERPYPDAARARRYDEWRASRPAKGGSRRQH